MEMLIIGARLFQQHFALKFFEQTGPDNDLTRPCFEVKDIDFIHIT